MMPSHISLSHTTEERARGRGDRDEQTISRRCRETEAYEDVCQLADMRRRRENEEEVMLWLHLGTATVKWKRRGNSHSLQYVKSETLSGSTKKKSSPSL